jgi:Family of unknown function (DUF6065)
VNVESSVLFYQLLPGARQPQRADRSAGGTLPVRAFRYCEPACAAAGFGWYLFSPMDFTIVWDGSQLLWKYSEVSGWQTLGSAQFPGFANQFDQAAPVECRGYSPPFISATSVPGTLQLWSGVIARTRPEWSLLVRGPVNLPLSRDYEVFEGIVETDRWFGPLFSNIRIIHTNIEVKFRAEYPLFQVQPIQRHGYGDAFLNSFGRVTGVDALTPEDWQSYRETVVARNIASPRKLGAYAVEARKRRAAEVKQ